MATPIKSTNTPGNTAALNGVSPAVSDLLARVGAQGGDGQNPQLGFAQWMEKHAVTTMGAKPAASGTEVVKRPAAQGNESAKATEQALARSRQQAMMANKALENRNAGTSAPGSDAGEAARADNRAAHAQRKDGAAKPARSADKTASKAEGAQDKETDDKDEVSFNTAMGEGAAVVRELTPPPSIQAGDAAGMMAWLASLTQGDAPAGKLAGESEGLAGTARLQEGDGRGADAALLDTKGGAAGAVALDNPLWQSVSANTASLQVDAMLGKAAQAGEGRSDIDPLASLMSAGGLKGAGFGQGVTENASAVRHESATLSTPFGSPDFPQALAEKVSMWVSSAKTDGTMTAELHLNPAEMGPINVKISLDGQSAQVDFAAAAVETRKAIEASLSTLSSALSDIGLNMTGGDVSSQTAQQQFDQGFAQSQGGSGRSSGAMGRGDAEPEADLPAMRPVQAPRPGRQGGLDLYA